MDKDPNSYTSYKRIKDMIINTLAWFFAIGICGLWIHICIKIIKIFLF
ncbi:MAG: hypothetical protein ABIL40_09585 [candidate division WOR-3 bacterium]